MSTRDEQREKVDINKINIRNKKPQTEVKSRPKAQETQTAEAPSANQPKFEPPAELVDLPSHGYLYEDVTEDEDILNGQIRIRPMTHHEEKILATNRLIKSGQALDMVFQNCIKSKIAPEDLLTSDRLFLMFWLRGISYGHEYSFQIRCQNPACERKFKFTADISQQPIKEIDQSVKEPIVVKLPKTQATVHYHLPRGRDEKEARRESNQVVDVNAIDNSTTKRLKALIEKIDDPEGNEIPKKDWLSFLDSLIAYDSSVLREDMMDKDGGVEPIQDIECPHCGETFDSDIPVTADFFRVNR